MNAVGSPEEQELQELGSGAWDNPTYSGAPSPRGTLKICTISSAVLPQPQPKQPEDGPQEKAHRTLVSSCCLHICRLALGSPIFPSGCEGKLGVALESLQGLRDLT